MEYSEDVSVLESIAVSESEEATIEKEEIEEEVFYQIGCNQTMMPILLCTIIYVLQHSVKDEEMEYSEDVSVIESIAVSEYEEPHEEEGLVSSDILSTDEDETAYTASEIITSVVEYDEAAGCKFRTIEIFHIMIMKIIIIYMR